jgi:replication factor C subunit 2/4
MSIPWIEKYRPVKIEDVIADDNILTEINNIIKTKNIPNMIFTGTPGIGKTTSILCIARKLYGPYMKDVVLELNASDERGIKTINNGIIGDFCNHKMSYKDEDIGKYANHKLIILDESDNMTEKVLPVISSLMDTHHKTTRFVFTCNTSSKIIESIQSRCKIIRFTRLNIAMMAERLENIIKIENKNIKNDLPIKKRTENREKIDKISYTKEGLRDIAELSGGDMRYGINILQLVSDRFRNINTKNISIICDIPSSEILEQILILIKSKDIKSALQEAYKLKESGYSVNDIFTAFFHYLKTAPTKIIDEAYKMQILYVLSYYIFNVSRFTDTDINLTAFILELGKN